MPGTKDISSFFASIKVKIAIAVICLAAIVVPLVIVFGLPFEGCSPECNDLQICDYSDELDDFTCMCKQGYSFNKVIFSPVRLE